jgi:hypothetical protein
VTPEELSLARKKSPGGVAKMHDTAFCFCFRFEKGKLWMRVRSCFCEHCRSGSMDPCPFVEYVGEWVERDLSSIQLENEHHRTADERGLYLARHLNFRPSSTANVVVALVVYNQGLK